MMVSVLAFTMVGSYVSSLVPNRTMGNFSVFMTMLMGIKFIVKPVMTTKESMMDVPRRKRAVQSVICGCIVGFICGFVGAGGGIMMLLVLTSVLGYELKTAVGTSYRTDRCFIPFRNWRNAGYRDTGFVCDFYISLGKNRSQICK